MIDWADFKPGVGKLLLSEPTLPDPNFARTVILLVAAETPEGSLGFVLNRRMEIRLSDLGGDFTELGHYLYEGGPVEHDTLHVVHRCQNVPGAVEISPGVYWGGNFPGILDRVKASNEHEFRFFLGYSGWSAGQLERELEEKTWLVTESTAEDIFFPDPETLWKNRVRALGGEMATLADYPMDPSWN